MDRIGDYFVYCVPIPGKAKELITPCAEGFTVYVDDSLSPEERRKAFEHAIRHENDFEKADVQQIELEAHKKMPPARG